MMRMKLNEICEVYSGYALKSFNDAEDGLPVVKIGNILTDGTLNLDECQYTTDSVNEKYYSNKGDIYIALSGATTGKIGIMDADERYVVNQRVGIVRKKSDDVPQEYIKYFLLRQTDRILQEAAGCAQPNISPKQIAEYSVPEITKEKMFEVCGVLDKTKRIIDMRKAELTALDDLIKARFVEMFGNKGENPNGYEEDTLGNLYKFQYGKGNNIPEDKGEYPCYGSNGIVGHHTEYNNEDSPIIGHIGAYAGIVNWGAGKHYVTYNGVMCKLKTDRVNPTYGFHLLQQQDFNRVATKGGGQPFVSYGDLEAPIVVVPPIEVQEAYATFADKVDKSKVVVQKSLDETQQLFDSLMQKYFG